MKRNEKGGRNEKGRKALMKVKNITRTKKRKRKTSNKTTRRLKTRLQLSNKKEKKYLNFDKKESRARPGAPFQHEFGFFY